MRKRNPDAIVVFIYAVAVFAAAMAAALVYFIRQ
jgi:uncharacterized membrane protein